MKKIRFRSKSNFPLIAAEIFAIIYQSRVMFSFQFVVRAHSCWELNTYVSRIEVVRHYQTINCFTHVMLIILTRLKTRLVRPVILANSIFRHHVNCTAL